MNKEKECIENMNKIIEELCEAKHFLLREKFECAEHELTDALSESAKVLHCINDLENYKEVKN